VDIYEYRPALIIYSYILIEIRSFCSFLYGIVLLFVLTVLFVVM